MVVMLHAEDLEDLLPKQEEILPCAIPGRPEIYFDDAFHLSGILGSSPPPGRKDIQLLHCHGYKDDGFPVFLLDGPDIVLKLHSGNGVQGPEGLVHEDDLRIGREGSGKWLPAAAYRRRADEDWCPQIQKVPQAPGSSGQSPPAAPC